MSVDIDGSQISIRRVVCMMALKMLENETKEKNTRTEEHSGYSNLIYIYINKSPCNLYFSSYFSATVASNADIVADMAWRHLTNSTTKCCNNKKEPFFHCLGNRKEKRTHPSRIPYEKFMNCEGNVRYSNFIRENP